MRELNLKSMLGAAVRNKRNELGFSQEELADRSGLHRTYISDVERGARNISLESIDKLAKALKISIASLFNDASTVRHGSSRDGALKEAVDILLVEDDPHDVELTLRAFKQARVANRIQVVRDGAEALDFVFCKGHYARRKIEDQPQLILLDLNLPKISGIEVLRQIKADERMKAIHVVVLTVSQSDRDIAQCRSLGVETYIVKPVDINQFSEITAHLKLYWALLKDTEIKVA